jgi:hypothetical protein
LQTEYPSQPTSVGFPPTGSQKRPCRSESSPRPDSRSIGKTKKPVAERARAGRKIGMPLSSHPAHAYQT